MGEAARNFSMDPQELGSNLDHLLNQPVGNDNARETLDKGANVLEHPKTKEMMIEMSKNLYSSELFQVMETQWNKLSKEFQARIIKMGERVPASPLWVCSEMVKAGLLLYKGDRDELETQKRVEKETNVGKLGLAVARYLPQLKVLKPIVAPLGRFLEARKEYYAEIQREIVPIRATLQERRAIEAKVEAVQGMAANDNALGTAAGE